MAPYKHPITGVTLNAITEKRPRLDEDHAVTAWLLKLQGETYTDIVHMLGTNANRVGEVFRGTVHRGAREIALALLRKKSLLT